MVNEIEIVKNLDVPSGTNKRMDCPFCYHRNTFSVRNENGKLLWNCFHASCKAKGKKQGEKNMDYVKKTLDLLSKKNEIFISDEFELLDYTVNSYVQWDHFKDCNKKNSRYDFKILISGGTSIYGEDKWPQTDLKRMVQKELKERLGLKRVAIYNLSLPGADNDWTARSIMNAYHILHPDFFIACWQPQENQYEYEKLQYMMDCFFLMIQRKYAGMQEHKPQRRTVDYHPFEVDNEKRNYAPRTMKYINGHIERIKN